MSSERRLRRTGGFTGLFLIGLAGTILVVSLLSNPWFSLQRHSISDLGRRSASFNRLYNGGLVVVGLLFVFFLSQAYREWEDSLHRIGLGLFGLTGLSLVLVGFVSNGVELPDPYALAFALTGGIGVGLLGVAMLRRDVAYARLFVAVIVPGLGLAIGAILTFEGLAIAEFIAVGGYVVTIGVLAVQLLRPPE